MWLDGLPGRMLLAAHLLATVGIMQEVHAASSAAVAPAGVWVPGIALPMNPGGSEGTPAAALQPAPDLDFDIPAQSLQAALEQYSAMTGISVLYLGTLVTGRVSTAVKGRYASRTALQLLIEGTGLAASYTTAEAFILVPGTPDQAGSASAPGPRPAPAAYQGYYGAVQASLRNVLCRDSRIAPGRFRAALQFWVDPAGHVSEARLLDTTGDKVRDVAIVRALRDTDVGRPPLGLEQPFTMVLLPRAAAQRADCRAE